MDVVSGGADVDVVSGGAGVDVVSGGADVDVVSGGADVDVVSGGAAVDVVMIGADGSESEPAPQVGHATCRVGSGQYWPAGHIAEAVEPAGQYCAGALQAGALLHEAA